MRVPKLGILSKQAILADVAGAIPGYVVLTEILSLKFSFSWKSCKVV